MSTTTTTPVRFDGDESGLPTAIPVERVESIMAEGTTSKRAYAVAWREAGIGTNEEGGLSMEGVFGSPVKSGGFGNLVTDGLKDTGRIPSEGRAPRTSAPRTAVPSGVLGVLKAYNDRANALHTAWSGAYHEVDSFDAALVIDAEVGRLESEIDALVNERDALMTDDGAASAFTDEHLTRIIAARDRLADAYADGVKAINDDLVPAGLAPIMVHDTPLDVAPEDVAVDEEGDKA